MPVAGKPILKLPGLHFPLRMLDNGFVVQEVDFRDDPRHDEAWVARESAKYGGTHSVYWQQNYERKLIRGGQPVWPMLREEIHVRTFTPEEWNSTEWSIWRSLDHGMRHPTCCAWVAVNKDGDKVFFRQYYRTDATIAMNAMEILRASPKYIAGTVADPSVWKRNDVTGEILADVYAREGLSMTQADRSRAGYEAVTTGLVATVARYAIFRNDLDILRNVLNAPGVDMALAERLRKHPAIYFTPEVCNGQQSLFRECVNFRYKEKVGGDDKADPETFIDVDDEGSDVVRYAVQTPAVRWNPAEKPKKVKDVFDIIMAHGRDS